MNIWLKTQAKKEDDPAPILDEQATNNELKKLLLDFIKETRDNFSTLNGDGNHDFEMLQTVNQNVTTLTGKVENLTLAVKKLLDVVTDGNTAMKETMENKVDEIKETVEPKKFIVKEVPHFSVRLWFKSRFHWLKRL